MDYQKNILILDDMANQYVNSSVVMFGLVANWIPIYKFYIEIKNAFGGNITVDAGIIPLHWLHLLVNCFWFNGPLRQYFSIISGCLQKEGERKENDR